MKNFKMAADGKYTSEAVSLGIQGISVNKWIPNW